MLLAVIKTFAIVDGAPSIKDCEALKSTLASALALFICLQRAISFVSNLSLAFCAFSQRLDSYFNFSVTAVNFL